MALIFQTLPKAQCLKITQNVGFEFFKFDIYSTNFCPFKIDLSGKTIKLLSTENINVARFAHNVECNFFLCTKEDLTVNDTT